jgi:DNA processing protein
MIGQLKTMGAETCATTKYWMALSSVRGVGPRTVRMLINRFGSPEEVLSASAIEIARMPRMNLRLARDVVGTRRKLAGFESFIAQTAETGIDILCPDSFEYPGLLKSTEDSPPILYKRGLKLPGEEPAIAIVGTRSPTAGGVEAAGKMAEWLAGTGIVVVSGLAKGIDTSAHKGSLKAGGKTVAVLGSGLRMIHPRENRQLADDICVNGAILSECHPNEVVSSQRLIQRNRIISGISSGVILVDPRSGALHTAERALRQNRHIFVYEPEDAGILPQWLSEAAFPIRGIDELNIVLDHLQTVKSRGGQMHLL